MYLPLDEKAVKKIRKKYRAWQHYMEIRDEKTYQEYAKLRNHVKISVKRPRCQWREI